MWTQWILVATICWQWTRVGEASLTSPPPAVVGLHRATSQFVFTQTVQNIMDQLTPSTSNFTLLRAIDYTVDDSVPPHQLIVLSHSSLEESLLKQTLRVGLDLPIKMLVYQEVNGGTTYIAYNSLDYLDKRYLQLASIETAYKEELLLLVEAAAGQILSPEETPTRQIGPSMWRVSSPDDFQSTWTRLLDRIEASQATISFTVDYQPFRSHLVVFGSSEWEVPLIEKAATFSIDLPLKILVVQDQEGGPFTLVTNRINFLQWRHNLSDDDSLEEIFDSMRALVESLMRSTPQTLEPSSPLAPHTPWAPHTHIPSTFSPHSHSPIIAPHTHQPPIIAPHTHLPTMVAPQISAAPQVAPASVIEPQHTHEPHSHAPHTHELTPASEGVRGECWALSIWGWCLLSIIWVMT